MAFGDAGYLTQQDYQEVLNLVAATGTTFSAQQIAGSIYERTARAEIRECLQDNNRDADAIVEGENQKHKDSLRDAYLYRIASHLVQTAPRLSSQESAGLSQEWIPADLDALRADLLSLSEQQLTRILDETDGVKPFIPRIHFTRGGPDV